VDFLNILGNNKILKKYTEEKRELAITKFYGRLANSES